MLLRAMIPDPEATRRHLEKLLASEQMQKADASRKLLAYLAERSIRQETPKELEIAVDVFGRNASFNGAEDSLVRVHVRTLRQRLAEYYAGAGREDSVHFEIPKGAYRLLVVPQTQQPQPSPPPPTRTAFNRTALVLSALLLASLLLNVYQWRRLAEPQDSTAASVRESAIWGGLLASDRTLTIVLGDMFMFSQLDPKTGRTQTVRDPAINSSAELRAFLASNPSLASERGQREATLILKSAAVGMASILPIVDRPGRRVEIRLPDELQAEDIRHNDIVYIGPFVRLGPLAGHYLRHSRYRYDTASGSLTDTVSHKDFVPAGELADQRTDYGIAAKFRGPTGNQIMVLAAMARNAGLLQIVKTLTSAEGLEGFHAALDANADVPADSFEALLAVTGFRRTDLGAEVIAVNSLPARLQRTAAAPPP
jgi:hypothetical protein